MKELIKLLILFSGISVQIIFTTCDPRKNYEFTGIQDECGWDLDSLYFSKKNISQGDTIVIRNFSAHILFNDILFLSKSRSTSDDRMECEFTVKAPQNNGIAASIQQMNFDKQCSNFIQFTNQNGSLDRIFCDKFVGNIPHSFLSSFPRLNSDNYSTEHHDLSKREIFISDGNLKVKISVTKENVQDLKYLLIVFTALEKDASSEENFLLAPKYYCDGIRNYNKANDENNCKTFNDYDKYKNYVEEPKYVETTYHAKTTNHVKKRINNNMVIAFVLLFGVIIFMVSIVCMCQRIKNEQRPTNSNELRNNSVPVRSSTGTAGYSNDIENTPDIPHSNLSIHKELPTYESLFPKEPIQTTRTSIHHM